MPLAPQNGSRGAPIQPLNKAAAAAPKLNSEAMEMNNLPGGEAPVQEDIMQLARVGNIQAMEKLFETGDYDATYTDDEGITPLHVCASTWQYREDEC
jgi:palmitoyltransferase ZDHHC13/17